MLGAAPSPINPGCQIPSDGLATMTEVDAAPARNVIIEEHVWGKMCLLWTRFLRFELRGSLDWEMVRCSIYSNEPEFILWLGRTEDDTICPNIPLVSCLYDIRSSFQFHMYPCSVRKRNRSSYQCFESHKLPTGQRPFTGKERCNLGAQMASVVAVFVGCIELSQNAVPLSTAGLHTEDTHRRQVVKIVPSGLLFLFRKQTSYHLILASDLLKDHGSICTIIHRSIARIRRTKS